MNIQHVSIPRPPGEASRAQARSFFVELLGLEEIPVPRSIQFLDLVWLQVGDLEIHVFAEESVADASRRHFCLAVDDLDAVRQKLVRAGYKPWEPDRIPGRPRFFCRDPFGNIIEFTTIRGDYLVLEGNA